MPAWPQRWPIPLRLTLQAPGNECQSMQLAHRVRVGVDWGNLPLGKQQRWTELGCDRVVN